MQKSIVTIKKSNTVLSVVHCDRNYIIGFTDNYHAKYVKHVLSTFPRLELKSHRPANIKHEINCGLLEMGITPFQNGDVTIDITAQLKINKRKDDVPDSDYQLADVDYSDFLMYPFDKGLGVVMPYQIVYEDQTELHFLTQVVDPTNDVSMFAKNLKI